jgi:alanine dehydrogenase
VRVGVPKEIKNREFRVAMVAAGVRSLVAAGHKVLIEKNAGVGAGISDDEYRAAGATIVPSASEVWSSADMIVKVKEPLAEEFQYLRPNLILFTYLHLAAAQELGVELMKKKVTGIAYETIQLADGSLPLLKPMSEVAGRMAVQIGAFYLQKYTGGKGILLSGVPGVERGRVTIIGGGVAGLNAAKIAVGLGADVKVIDRDIKRMEELDNIFEGRLTTIMSNFGNIEEAVTNSDLVIGSVLIAGARAPKLVTREMISKMEKGSVVVDISVDQGGCIETCKPTTHENPTFEVDGVIHYCVANMPGAVARTSTYALTNVTANYITALANKGLERAVHEDKALFKGINTFSGNIVHAAVAEAVSQPYVELRI